MAHEIEANNAFFLKTPAWHNLGVTLENAPTWQEAQAKSYPYDLTLLPSSARIDTDNGPVYIDQSEYKLVVRSDSKILGQVGARYTLVQPAQIWQSFEPLLQSNLIELESGGSLRDGKRMWALARVKNSETDIIPNDTIRSYILFATSFDGSLRTLLKPTDTRVVCANTLRMALADNEVPTTFKHTKSIHDKIISAQSIVKKSLEGYKKRVEDYKQLAKKYVSDKQVNEYVHAVFDVDDKADNSTKTENKIDNVIDLIHDRKELELIPALRGTAWNAFNGITHYLQHEHGRSNDSRVDSMWFGESARLSQKAFNLAMTM